MNEMIAVYRAVDATACWIVCLKTTAWEAWVWEVVDEPPTEFMQRGYRWKQIGELPR